MIVANHVVVSEITFTPMGLLTNLGVPIHRT